jgi:hypothetical protein
LVRASHSDADSDDHVHANAGTHCDPDADGHREPDQHLHGYAGRDRYANAGLLPNPIADPEQDTNADRDAGASG